MISLEVTTTRWRVNMFQAQITRISRCRRTKATMLVTIGTRIRKTGINSTTECKTIRNNWDETNTTEVSTLTRTLLTSIMLVNSTRISSLKRVGGNNKAKAVDITSTLSRTSTEGQLQMGQMWSTLQPRIKRWISAITMIKCLLAQRIHSKETATISRTKSLSSLINHSTRHTPKKNLLKQWTTHNPALRNRIKRNKTTVCWWQSCEMGGGRTKTFDCS